MGGEGKVGKQPMNNNDGLLLLILVKTTHVSFISIRIICGVDRMG